ncbi:alpha-galactosidase [Saccharothrix sp. S26]|uniref:glycoside hydrolase family 36 protein n=1 Tax=Saccharothrix sp. S26 TaxID=2907215 RepID=UPI001F1E5AF1|nr:glycoside hydrolase family 36 protein [Saccharothrix sp. S26]MCE6997969.1 alpha-galactosidase [Saccharothrix sp. S26]
MTVTWSTGAIGLVLGFADDRPVSLLSLRPDGPVEGIGVPLVEVQALGHGRFPGSHRYADTTIGARLRYRTHTASASGLRVVQHDPVSGLVVTSVFEGVAGVPALRTWTEVDVEGEPVRLQAVTSLSTGAFLVDSGRSVDEVDLVHADSDWVAESRWRRTPLREVGLVRMDPPAHHHASRSRFALTSRSSWSTGEHLPTGVLVARDDSWALAWQVEHNGAWHWEVGETFAGAYLAVLGPTDAEHQWSRVVSAGRGFATVPVSVAVVEGGVDEAFGALTRQRRATLRDRRAPELPVIFNDYMNTLMGDPTTEKLLPLIDAAAEVGADCFCVDAGWYDEDGRWWDSVGEWRPSRTRFPGGFGEVADRIRERGMVPGIWLEPEVVGVRSAVARSLPEEAFFRRHGERVVEHGRFHLDFRHPAAVRHVDEVVDRLVDEFGIGYLKLDYNIMPGPGSDVGGVAPGEGLLGHNRAHLAWLDALLARHPGLLLENCASGAMRMDYAMLSRLHVQSTSDQQNPLLYPPIAAAAPASVLPEQAANWAYAQPGMTPSQAAFTLATGVLGRLYLAGRVDLMDAARRSLVAEAVWAHKALRPEIAASVPFWPLGLTGRTGPWVAQGLRAATTSYLTLWRLPDAPPDVDLPVPHLDGRDVVVSPVFPAASPEWDFEWHAGRGVLRATHTGGAPAAVVIRLGT